MIDRWDNEGEKGHGLRSLLGNKNIAGVWTWSHGDGWAGPYKTNELWTDLNAGRHRQVRPATRPSRSGDYSRSIAGKN